MIHFELLVDQLASVWITYAAISVPCLVLIGLIFENRLPGLRFRPPPASEPARWGWPESIVAILGYYVLMIFAGIGLIVGLDLEDSDGPKIQAPAMIFAGSLTLTYVFLQVRRVYSQPWSSLGLGSSSWRNLLPTLALLVLLTAPLNWLAMVWQVWAEVFFGEPATEQGVVTTFRDAAQNSGPLVISGLVFSAVVGAPIVEEVLFRGVLFGFLRHRHGVAVAVVLSSLLFGAFHQNLYAFVPLSALALVFAGIYQRSGSLYCATLAHALFNGASLSLIVLSGPS